MNHLQNLIFILLNCRTSYGNVNPSWPWISVMSVSFTTLEVPASLSSFWNMSPLLLLYLFPNIPLFLFKSSLSSCSKRWCVCSARRMPRGSPFIALCRLFYLSDRHPPRIVSGYQSSPADHITACVRLWPISGFTSKSDSYHYLHDK